MFLFTAIFLDYFSTITVDGEEINVWIPDTAAEERFNRLFKSGDTAECPKADVSSLLNLLMLYQRRTGNIIITSNKNISRK